QAHDPAPSFRRNHGQDDVGKQRDQDPGAGGLQDASQQQKGEGGSRSGDQGPRSEQKHGGRVELPGGEALNEEGAHRDQNGNDEQINGGEPLGGACLHLKG